MVCLITNDINKDGDIMFPQASILCEAGNESTPSFSMTSLSYANCTEGDISAALQTNLNDIEPEQLEEILDLFNLVTSAESVPENVTLQIVDFVDRLSLNENITISESVVTETFRIGDHVSGLFQSENSGSSLRDSGPTLVQSLQRVAYKLELIMGQTYHFTSFNLVVQVGSVAVGNTSIYDLNNPVNITYVSVTSMSGVKQPIDQFYETVTTETCVFWDFSLGDWSDEGCFLVENSNPPECLCDHLTNFAILVGSEVVPTPPVLRIVVLVCCSISCVALALAVVACKRW